MHVLSLTDNPKMGTNKGKKIISVELSTTIASTKFDNTMAEDPKEVKCHFSSQI